MALAARVRIPVGALLDRQNGVKVALGVVGPAVQVRSLVPALLLHISRDRGATAARRIPTPKVMGSTPVGLILDRAMLGFSPASILAKQYQTVRCLG